MTQDEALRLWAYQWVTRGEIPDLPEDVSVIPASTNVKRFVVHLTPEDAETIDLRNFVVEDPNTIRTCRAGYGERTKTFVVTPVETHLW